MSDSIIKSIFERIRSVYGLGVNYAHESYMTTFVRQRAERLKLSLEDYFSLIKNSEEELTLLTDEAAINETYFFREDKQFDFLKDFYFKDKSFVNIWCASCSSGEEPISVYSLTKNCGIPALVYASDIDTKALATFRNGVYSKNSFRMDGNKYHQFIKNISTEVLDENSAVCYKINEQDLASINIFRHNLAGNPEYDFPIEENSLDVIFVRNVFIYFNEETRKFILKKLTNFLKPGGIILFAMSEIASISEHWVSELKKENRDSVYYFRKTLPGEKLSNSFTVLKENPIENKENSVKINSNIEKIDEKTDYVERMSLLLEKKKSEIPQIILPASETPRNLNKDQLVDFSKKILQLLDRRNFEKSAQLLNEMKFRANNIEFKYYFHGLIDREKGNLREAEENFVRAGVAKPHFWPAKYQLGLLYNQTNRETEMKNSFSDCIKDLMDYSDGSGEHYEFLFEGFDSSYFMDLCQRFLYKKD